MPRNSDLYKSINLFNPITKQIADDEKSLTAYLAVYHQLGKIDWPKVPIYLANEIPPARTSNEFIKKDMIVCSEWPLLWDNESQKDRWGGMKPDLVFFSTDCTEVVFLEGKVNSKFTHSNNPPDGQLSRYLEYINSLENPKSLALGVICPRDKHDGYRENLQAAMAHDSGNAMVKGFTMLWEEIIAK